MTDPFENISQAFEPYFQDLIRIYRPKTELNCSLKAVLFDDGVDEVFSDNGTSSTRRLISAIVKKYSPTSKDGEDCFWPYSETQPQIGDVIELVSGRKFAVTDVDVLDRNHYTLKARSFK